MRAADEAVLNNLHKKKTNPENKLFSLDSQDESENTEQQGYSYSNISKL
jgi:hypothetical protein